MTMPRKTKDWEDQAEKFVRMGITARKAAIEWNCTEVVAKKRLIAKRKELGLAPKGQKIDMEVVAGLRAQGLREAEIAGRLDCSERQVVERIKIEEGRRAELVSSETRDMHKALCRALGMAWVADKIGGKLTHDNELVVLELHAALNLDNLDAERWLLPIRARLAEIRRESVRHAAEARGEIR